MSSFHPLFALSKRVRDEGSFFDVRAEDFLQVGEIDAQGEVPQLWLPGAAPKAAVSSEISRS